ncbi:MAG TPA: NFACT RNA binding domain-containing protein [Lunatimonas sp.]|nr:NFACT RNA binding domain-containing protein [Lunatimonas sp.]
MHLNYHYFRFLCPALARKIASGVITACFSQSKDELVFEVDRENGEPFFVVAHLLPAAPCLYFPSDFKRSKKNNVTLFPDILGEKIGKIRLFAYERAFSFQFESGKQLLFKMHGSRSNVLYFDAEASAPDLIFRNELQDDWKLTPEELDNPLDLGKERFIALEGNASQFLPTLGKLPRAWLKKAGYLEADLDTRYSLIQEVMDLLDSSFFSIVQEDGQYLLTLLPSTTAIFTSADPLLAANAYYKYAVIRQGFDKEKSQLTKLLSDQLKKTHAYITKSYQKLEELETATSPGQLADIIMANLHQIPTGTEQITLYDFYRDQMLPVTLKRELSPQKFAENLYRKAKNRKKEIAQLEKNIGEKEKHAEILLAQKEEVAGLTHFRELRAFTKEQGLSSASKEIPETTPYKRFEAEGFDILVGKSARANDELLRKFAWKEDMWLHAKDVSGSHVLIKYKSGLTFPKSVLERAGELAGYYSKNRNESLCAVIYTPVKFVRKVKGSAPGAVMVDKESILMVHPVGPEGETK